MTTAHALGSDESNRKVVLWYHKGSPARGRKSRAHRRHPEPLFPLTQPASPCANPAPISKEEVPSRSSCRSSSKPFRDR